MRRLNPADHFTLMMDREIRSAGLVGNLCALGLELDGVPDVEEIRRRCVDFQRRFAVAGARLTRRGRQFFWKFKQPEPIPFRVESTYCDGVRRDRDGLVRDALNRPEMPERAPPFELVLIVDGSASVLMLRWFHPAFDAKGAELILYHLFAAEETGDQGGESIVDRLLAGWGLWQKAKLGYHAKRMIDRLDRLSSMLPSAEVAQASGYSFDLTTLDAVHSALIKKRAREQVGMTAESLYFIGCMMRALERVGCGDPGDAYCVPYAMTLRRRKALFPVFGNQVSFLFAQAPRDLVSDRQALFRHLREQSMTIVRQELDRAMLPLMQAGSWLSLERMGQIVRLSARGRERASFWFSYTGEMEPTLADVAGCAVRAVYPFSPVTAPPSIGLLVGQHRGAIVLSLNFIAEHFAAGWVAQLRAALVAELLDDGGA